MKPRIFIGSSVEGLSIAYAIQQNLLHNAETTVWDQGVFDLSSTTIESLSKVLSSSDFGIFVFSADDVIKIRDKESAAVRDNVLFEMGLFIGKLGRERVFFVIPEATDIHIPSDLLGVTPGKFDPNRSDGSMQAATGPVSHQIRTQIKTLGLLNSDKTPPSEPEKTEESDANEAHWIYDFIDKRYDTAIEKLRLSVGSAGGLSPGISEAWVANCEFKKNRETGLVKFTETSVKFSLDPDVQVLIASFLRSEKHIDKATELLNSLPSEIVNLPTIRVALAECHASNEEGEKAIELLNKSDPRTNPDVALCLAKLQEENDDTAAALKTVISAYSNNRRHTQLRYKIATLAIDKDENEIGLYLLDELTKEFPKISDYFGYLGNCCTGLNLTDQAMQAYKKAEEIASSNDSAWIINNIGNLYLVKGFASEAITHLKRGLEINDNSDYAHERLSRSLKVRDEEQKLMLKMKKNGAQKLRELCSIGDHIDSNCNAIDKIV